MVTSKKGVIEKTLRYATQSSIELQNLCLLQISAADHKSERYMWL